MPAPSPQTPWQPPASRWQAPGPAAWQAPPAGWQPGPGPVYGSSPYGVGPTPWQPPAGYGQPAYGSSSLAITAAIVLLVMGALLGIVAISALVIGLAGADVLELADPTLVGLGRTLVTFVVILGLTFLVVSVLHFAAGIGELVHRGWARWLGIVLGLLGVVLGVLILLGSIGDPTLTAVDWAIEIGWTVAYAVVVLGLAFGSRHFRQLVPPR